MAKAAFLFNTGIKRGYSFHSDAMKQYISVNLNSGNEKEVLALLYFLPSFSVYFFPGSRHFGLPEKYK